MGEGGRGVVTNKENQLPSEQFVYAIFMFTVPEN